MNTDRMGYDMASRPWITPEGRAVLREYGLDREWNTYLEQRDRLEGWLFSEKFSDVQNQGEDA